MHSSKMFVVCAVAMFLMAEVAKAQVLLAIGGLAVLAIAKEKIIFSEISRQRGVGKREAESAQPDFGAFFNAIAVTDVSDCGKMLVCQIFAKPEGTLTIPERRVAALFSDVKNVDVSSGVAAYQLAALEGNLKRPEVCYERYAKCPVDYKTLEDVLEAQSA